MKSAVGLRGRDEHAASTSRSARARSTRSESLVRAGHARTTPSGPTTRWSPATPTSCFYAGRPLAGTARPGRRRPLPGGPAAARPRRPPTARSSTTWRAGSRPELAADADAVQASEIQRRLLPRKAPDVLGYDIAGRCQPAFNVGGDYYDWHLLDDTMLQVTVADVMGKGLAAGVIAAGLRTAMRVTSRVQHPHRGRPAYRREPAGRLRRLRHLRHDVHRPAAPQHGHLEYVDAGHGLALVVARGSPTRQLAGDDLPLGARRAVCGSHEARLEPGDTLIVVSDGVLEAFPDPEEASAPRNSWLRPRESADEMADRILAEAAGTRPWPTTSPPSWYDGRPHDPDTESGPRQGGSTPGALRSTTAAAGRPGLFRRTGRRAPGPRVRRPRRRSPDDRDHAPPCCSPPGGSTWWRRRRSRASSRRRSPPGQSRIVVDLGLRHVHRLLGPRRADLGPQGDAPGRRRPADRRRPRTGHDRAPADQPGPRAARPSHCGGRVS